MLSCYHRHRPDLQSWYDRGLNAGQQHPTAAVELLMNEVLLEGDEEFSAEILAAVKDGIRLGQRQPVTRV